MAFNVGSNVDGTDKVSTAIRYDINVDGTNVKVLPAGSAPTVVYRVGDGTVHPDGFDNELDLTYLDFYISTGATGAKGDKGEDGASAYAQAVAGGYGGTESEFYTLLTTVTDTAVLAQASADAAALSETNALASENASAANLVLTNADVVTTNADVLLTNADVLSTAADAVSTAADVATATAQALAASNSATSASGSASAADASAQAAAVSLANIGASETNSANSATSAQLKAWEAEARKLTADSYATEAEDTFVNSFASDGDGTFTVTPTSDYSALHWAAKSALAAGRDASVVVVDSSGFNNVLSAADNTVQKALQTLDNTFVPYTTPTISFTSPVNENGSTTVTITNYDADATYFFGTTVGTVTYTSGNTATFNAKDITDGDDDIGVITCYATKPLFLQSATASEPVTVTFVNVISDTAVTYNSTEFTTTNY